MIVCIAVFQITYSQYSTTVVALVYYVSRILFFVDVEVLNVITP